MKPAPDIEKVFLVGASDAVLRQLLTARCAREVRERTGLQRKTVEGAIWRLHRDGLVVCVTPDLRQSRLYALSPLGRLWLHNRSADADLGFGDTRLAHRLDEPQQRLAIEKEDPVLLALHAWLQAGRYRRLVLRHLTASANARQLRAGILTEYQRIGLSHVRTTLREFEQRRVVERAGRLWTLTFLGRRLQSMDAQGLPKWRPVRGRPLN